MGVFTIYCAACGGPAMNVGSWAEEKKEEGDLKDFPLDEESGQWLDEGVLHTHACSCSSPGARGHS